jgi:septal ring factor EnvC (AmiA/AmiB activator)
MRRVVGAAVLAVAMLGALPEAQAGWRRAADKLSSLLDAEIALSRTAADLQRGLTALDRERGGLEYSAEVLGHASRESMRRLDAYRRLRSDRERTSRKRARALYKLTRGGVARLAFEDLGQEERTSGERVGRGRTLQFVVQHDVEELSVHRRAETRACAELVAAARELDALGALATVQAMQEHVLVSTEQAVVPELRRVFRSRRRAARRVDDRALRLNRSSLREATENWKALRELQGLEGSSRLIRPVRGRTVGRFGEYVDEVLRLPMVRNGVELHAGRNERVRAMADGHVAVVTRLPGFEEVVVVDHGSGQYTLTARLWRLDVAEGDEVDAGDFIGRVAPKKVDDGLGRTVYIELRHGEKPIDPSPYLRRARSEN